MHSGTCVCTVYSELWSGKFQVLTVLSHETTAALSQAQTTTLMVRNFSQALKEEQLERKGTLVWPSRQPGSSERHREQAV